MNDKETENLYIEKDGKNVKMTITEIYEVVQQQQQIINACKEALDRKTIYFKDEKNEKMELTQEIFDYIVKKINNQLTNDDDDVEIDVKEEDSDEDVDSDSDNDPADEDDNEEDILKLNKLEETLNDSHGNNCSNINFTKS